jgi:hypothetical protein
MDEELGYLLARLAVLFVWGTVYAVLAFLIGAAAMVAITAVLAWIDRTVIIDLWGRYLAWFCAGWMVVASMVLGEWAWGGLVACASTIGLLAWSRALGLLDSKRHVALAVVLGLGLHVVAHVAGRTPRLLTDPVEMAIEIASLMATFILVVPALRSRAVASLKPTGLALVGALGIALPLSQLTSLGRIHDGPFWVLWVVLVVGVLDLAMFVARRLSWRSMLSGRPCQLGCLAVAVAVSAPVGGWLLALSPIVSFVISVAVAGAAALPQLWSTSSEGAPCAHPEQVPGGTVGFLNGAVLAAPLAGCLARLFAA